MAKKAIEQTGLIPRSIIRTLDRFKKQLFSGAEKLIIQEFRISRYQFLVSIKCLASLLFIPLIVNYLVKNFLLIPLTENFWNTQQSEVFLNSYQQDRAFHELEKFQEKLYFDYLINDEENFKLLDKCYANQIVMHNQPHSENKFSSETQAKLDCSFNTNQFDFKKIIQEKIQNKTLELAIYYNEQSILALTNLIGDFITFGVIGFLLIYMKPQIIILKSFLTESIYSLNDTKKSFLLILGTDLLVGFHSPRGWEICLELVLRHFGFPENKDFVFLFVASFPVLLDTVFKYWIFRYLNKISPSTVATYHSMIE